VNVTFKSLIGSNNQLEEEEDHQLKKGRAFEDLDEVVDEKENGEKRLKEGCQKERAITVRNMI